jgi:hypothetical protein
MSRLRVDDLGSFLVTKIGLRSVPGGGSRRRPVAFLSRTRVGGLGTAVSTRSARSCGAGCTRRGDAAGEAAQPAARSLRRLWPPEQLASASQLLRRDSDVLVPRAPTLKPAESDLTWAGFTALDARFPLPQPRITRPLTSLVPASGHPEDEPSAGQPAARISEGKGRMAELLDRYLRRRGHAQLPRSPWSQITIFAHRFGD